MKINFEMVDFPNIPTVEYFHCEYFLKRVLVYGTFLGPHHENSLTSNFPQTMVHVVSSLFMYAHDCKSDEYTVQDCKMCQDVKWPPTHLLLPMGSSVSCGLHVADAIQ